MALGILNEAIGLDLPIVAVSFPNVALARHPTFQESVQRLRAWGVTLIFDPDTYPLPTPNLARPLPTCFPGQPSQTRSNCSA